MYTTATNFTFVWQALLTLQGGLAGDNLGLSVGVAGTFIVGGAPNRAAGQQVTVVIATVGGLGVAGAVCDACMLCVCHCGLRAQGAVGIWSYKPVLGTWQWVQESELMRQNPLQDDAFGESVAIVSSGYATVGSSTKLVRSVWSCLGRMS